MNKKQNILKNIWFSFVIVPVIVIVIWAINTFWLEGNKTEENVFSMLIIFTLAMISEHFILSSARVKYRAEHYMFISISILLSIFISFFISHFILSDELKGIKKDDVGDVFLGLAISMISPGILFVLKSIIWYLLKMRVGASTKKDVSLEGALREIEGLKIKNEILEKKLEPEKEEIKKKSGFFRRNRD